MRARRIAWLGLSVCLYVTTGCGDSAVDDDDGGANAPSGGHAANGGDGSGAGDVGAGSSDGGGGSGGDGEGGSGPIDAGWTGACPSTLAERVRVTQIAGVDGTRGTLATAMDVLGDGGSRLAVAGPNGISVVRLTAQESLAGAAHTLEGHSVSGLVAHDDGTSLLVHRTPDKMVLVRLEEDGSERFAKTLIGDNDHQSEGDKYVVTNHPHYGRLRWDGSRYAAYFGHSQNWGSQGEHQGDLLWLLDESGTKLDGGWNWGCSHSWNARLVQHDALDMLFPLCESDAYPSTGVVVNNANNVVPGPAILGDAVAVPDGVLVVSSRHDGQGYQLVMAKVRADLSVEPPKTIMAAPDQAEMTAHLARYGSGFLVGWVSAPGASTFMPYNHNAPTTLAVIDEQGNILLGPETVDLGTSVFDELVTHANGDVGFPVVSTDSQTGELRVARVRYCE